MKKTLTILSLLSVLFLTACEEGSLSDSLTSELSGSHLILSTEESPSCTVSYEQTISPEGNVTLRNGVLYVPGLANQEKVPQLPVDVMSEGSHSIFDVYEATEFTYDVVKPVGLDTYDITVSGNGVYMYHFTGVEIGEDASGPYLKTNIDCLEGYTDQIYRLGDYEYIPDGGAVN